jgi:tetratricopeptide (TPR) repeat protein
MNVQLFIEEKSARQQQKLITLNKYIEKFPQGWKKRLELADLLYEIGKWSQAIIEYNQVIEQQPQLLDVHLKLGKILQLMGQEKEALQAYDTALFLSENPGTQHYIQGKDSGLNLRD